MARNLAVCMALAIACGGSSNGGSSSTGPVAPPQTDAGPAGQPDGGAPAQADAGTPPPAVDAGTPPPPSDGGTIVAPPPADAGTTTPPADGGVAYLYDVYDLGPQLGGLTANKITDDRVLIGNGYDSSTGVAYAFTYSLDTHQLTRYAPPHGDFFTIDERGNGVGYYAVSTGVQHAFFYRDGNFVDLGTLTSGGSSGASAFNESGQVIGSANVSAYWEYDPFFWQNGTMTDLGSFGGHGGRANAINGSGQVTGSMETHTGVDGWTHAFRWQNGTLQDLGTLYGTAPAGVEDISEGIAINSAGHVAGHSSATDGWHAVLWSNGTIRDLGLIHQVFGVNDSDVVIGDIGGDSDSRAVASVGGRMTDLNTVVAPSTFRLWHATGINSSGQIIGVGGENGGVNPRQFLLVPK